MVLTTERTRSVIDDVLVLDDMELEVVRLEATDRKLGEILVEHHNVAADKVETALAAQERNTLCGGMRGTVR